MNHFTYGVADTMKIYLYQDYDTDVPVLWSTRDSTFIQCDCQPEICISKNVDPC